MTLLDRFFDRILCLVGFHDERAVPLDDEVWMSSCKRVGCRWQEVGN